MLMKLETTVSIVQNLELDEEAVHFGPYFRFLFHLSSDRLGHAHVDSQTSHRCQTGRLQ